MIEAEVGRTPTGRRSYPVAYRVEFLRRWDECLERGAKARLMREDNLDRSTVQAWLKARDRGEFTAAMVAAAEKSRSRRMNNHERAEVARLRAENLANIDLGVGVVHAVTNNKVEAALAFSRAREVFHSLWLNDDAQWCIHNL